MIANVPTQVAVQVAVELDEAFVPVHDLELMYVGGGSDTGGVF